MFLFPPTIILRHRKENLKKCSLRGLEERSDLQFFTYPKQNLPDLSGYFLLTLDAPILQETDRHLGIFLIDGTWNYAEVMQRQLYRAQEGFMNFDSARQSQIEAWRAERRGPAPCRQGKEEDRFGKVAASQNSQNVTERGTPTPHRFQKRSLPPQFSTAYPRRQEDCADPSKGLASVEALFIAYSILGREAKGLLDHYYWKDEFLKKNCL